MGCGTLRVYLGAAAGVGKTYAMLNEGWRRADRGTDVVVGYVETHGREQTAAQLRDLEVVPRRTMNYRGQAFEEMDLDALLARRPQVALVDELAHSNVPGSRHAKRWQDVDELLTAGITVVTTVNIQHLESLNDVVERITGAAQQETVPDAVVRAADQVELVDMSPEALRRRMAHGSIYPPHKVDAALANYFRVGNLAALRELALLWLADRVDEGLHDYRRDHGIAEPWETKERVVVALTGAPGGDDLIRRAARISMRTRAELVGLHVRVGDGLAAPPTDALGLHRQLLEEFGGAYHEVSGTDVAGALVQYARAENATQLVLGASQRSRWTELTRGSVINRVLREAGGSMDVHVISPSGGPDGGAGNVVLLAPRGRLAALRGRRRAIGFALALGGLPALTLALANLRADVGLQDALLYYLLLVVLVATVGGAWPSAVAALGGSLLLNWFFTPPVHTLAIGSGRDLLAVAAFLVVAGVISALVDLATRRTADAYRAQAEAQALARMASRVMTDENPVPALVSELVAAFELEGAAVLVPGKDGWEPDVVAGAHPPASPVDGLGVALPDGSQLVLRSPDLRAEDRRLLNAFVAQLAVGLRARRLQQEAADASTLARANELRSALLAAVSHDLRTPLASIRAAATTLLSDDVSLEPGATKELLQTIDSEAERLNALVGDLLDMSRLQSGGLVVCSTAVGLEEIVASALSSVPGSALVDVDVPATLPRAAVDPALLERAVANVVENALRFSPPGLPVRVEAGVVAGRIDLRIVDRGCGIDPGDRDRVFLPFQRLGDNPGGAGVGLGLAVARGFVDAMGGELTIEDTPGGGCTMVISLATSP